MNKQKQSKASKKEQTWKPYTSQFQTILQSYNYENGMVLA